MVSMFAHVTAAVLVLVQIASGANGAASTQRNLMCAKPPKCLPCEDPYLIAEMDRCTGCCETFDTSGTISSSCTSCFKSAKSTRPLQIEGQAHVCHFVTRCRSSDECRQNPSPSSHASDLCKEYGANPDKSCCTKAETETRLLFQSAKNTINGMYDLCGKCADAWKHLFCTMSCSPHQGTFMEPFVSNSSITYKIHVSKPLAKKLWNSCKEDDTQDSRLIVYQVEGSTAEEQIETYITSSDNIMVPALYIAGLPQPVAIVVSSNSTALTETDLGDNYHVSPYCEPSVDTLVVMAMTIGTLLLILIVGSLIGNFLHRKHLSWLPESGVFILLGVGLGIAIVVVQGKDAAAALKFPPDTLTLVLLPPIIFYSGYSMSHGNFGANLQEIVILALFGTLLSTFIVGVGLWGLGDSNFAADYPVDLSLSEALAFAALISAVDPVATLATFDALQVDPNVEVLIFGESLLNDAVAIVLYKSFAKFAKYGGPSSHFSETDALLKFITLSLGSLGVAIGVGSVHALVFKKTFFEHTPVLEILSFLFLSYSSFVIAEMFHWSGIIASLVHGVFTALFVKPNMSEEGHFRAGLITHTIAALADMLIFVLVGVSSVFVAYNDISWSFTGATLVLILAARAVGVFPLVMILNLCRSKKRKILMGHAFLMWWSGLRGAIAIGLVAGMPSPLRTMMTSTTVIIVFFTVFVLGGGTAFVLKTCNIKMGNARPEAHGSMGPRMMKIYSSLLIYLTNSDLNGDGIDDRYQSKKYIKGMSRRGSIVAKKSAVNLMSPAEMAALHDKHSKTRVRPNLGGRGSKTGPVMPVISGSVDSWE